MKASKFAFSLAVAAIAPFGLTACEASSPAPQGEEAAAPLAAVTTIEVADLSAQLDAGSVTLIDVRTPEEFAAGHIAGATNIPLDSFDPAALPREDGKQVVLYCRSGNRSGQAAEKLAAHDGSATHLAGGIVAWEGTGKPVEQ
ncbi:MAG: rhodanese-like domain-containing protein [Sphingomonadaceae bacterium]|nr:rhodanese-like domain-containing protein [Sphingomonadaceae bacterium]